MHRKTQVDFNSFHSPNMFNKAGFTRASKFMIHSTILCEVYVINQALGGIVRIFIHIIIGISVILLENTYKIFF